MAATTPRGSAAGAGDAPTAAEFVTRLHAMASDEERHKIQRYFAEHDAELFLGVRMGDVFALAREFVGLDPREIETVLQDEHHEVRAGALSVMDKQARARRTPVERRRELFELYLRRHDRIDNWDLVDVAAPHVVGGWLSISGGPRDVLYELARSASTWERRTAIVACSYFLLRDKESDDLYAIAELLLDDQEDLIHKPVGGWLRHAGTFDPARLRAFLDAHAARMPRVMLRYATEKLPDDEKRHYRALH